MWKYTIVLRAPYNIAIHNAIALLVNRTSYQHRVGLIRLRENQTRIVSFWTNENSVRLLDKAILTFPQVAATETYIIKDTDYLYDAHGHKKSIVSKGDTKPMELAKTHD